MGLFTFVTQLWTPSSREEALDRVIRRTTPEVVTTVGRFPLGMCTAEARGYIRSRAIGETRRQVAVVIGEFPRLQGQQNQLLKDSLEQVTRLSLVQVREQLRSRFILKKAA